MSSPSPRNENTNHLYCQNWVPQFNCNRDAPIKFGRFTCNPREFHRRESEEYRREKEVVVRARHPRLFVQQRFAVESQPKRYTTRDLPTLGRERGRLLRRRHRSRQVRLPGYILSLIMRQLRRRARQRDCPRVEIYVLLVRRRASRFATNRPTGLDIIARRPGFRNPVSAAKITATTLRESPTCLETQSSVSAIVHLTRTSVSRLTPRASSSFSVILGEISSRAIFRRLSRRRDRARFHHALFS